MTKLARAMVTRYGMSEEFDMMALETMQNQYLGGDGVLNCGTETATKADKEILKIIKSAQQAATNILVENREKMDELAAYLLEKETITGEDFMTVLMGSKSKPEEIVRFAADFS